MWGETLRQVTQYPSAVLTGRDADGYPYSLRCRPRPDLAARALRVELPAGTPLRPGPAGLLCHRHDETLWRLQSVVIRGALVQDEQGWRFEPRAVIPGMDQQSPKAMLRFLLDSRRKAAAYLAKRGLPRPPIPWADINRVKAEAQREGAGRRATPSP
jgi:hypothetical protein